MSHVLRGLTYKFCNCFVDDIIVFSNNVEERIEHLQQVFDRLTAANLKLKPSKSCFASPRVSYLGLIFDKWGLHVCENKVKPVKTYPIPRNVHDIKVFLGFAGFYRRFIKGYSKITAPLTNPLKKDVPYKFTVDCKESFEKLKEALTTSPVLRFSIFDENVPFYLSTDASTVAIGYILSQKVNGQDRVIAYGGRSLKSCETRYSICELELLSLTEGVKHFRQYLTHQIFI